MKEKYIAPKTSAVDVLEHFCVRASNPDATQASDGPENTESHESHADAWGDVKEWNWRFED